MSDLPSHDAHFERYRADYARQLDEKYRAWRQQPRRADHAPWRQAPDPAQHQDNALEGLGRALSAPVLGATDQPHPTTDEVPVSGRIA